MVVSKRVTTADMLILLRFRVLQVLGNFPVPCPGDDEMAARDFVALERGFAVSLGSPATGRTEDKSRSSAAVLSMGTKCVRRGGGETLESAAPFLAELGEGVRAGVDELHFRIP